MTKQSPFLALLLDIAYAAEAYRKAKQALEIADYVDGAPGDEVDMLAYAAIDAEKRLFELLADHADEWELQKP